MEMSLALAYLGGMPSRAWLTAGLEAVKTMTYTFPKGMLAFPLARRQQPQPGVP